jgi:hypothetical protein
MKKILGIVMAMVMAVIVGVMPVGAYTSLSNGFADLRGDINGDGYITQADAEALRTVLRSGGNEPAYPEADVDENGVVNTRDYVVLSSIVITSPDVEVQNIIRTDMDIAAGVSHRVRQLTSISTNVVIIEYDGIVPNHTLERLGCTNIISGTNTKYVKAKISRSGGLTQFSAYYI